MYYHCSPAPGLTVLQPRTPEFFQKAGGVYLTTSLPMARWITAHYPERWALVQSEV